MPAKPKTPVTDPFSTTEKVMQTFRMPRDLVAFLRSEADRTGRDLTAFVIRHMEGLRTWFAPPRGRVRAARGGPHGAQDGALRVHPPPPVPAEPRASREGPRLRRAGRRAQEEVRP